MILATYKAENLINNERNEVSKGRFLFSNRSVESSGSKIALGRSSQYAPCQKEKRKLFLTTKQMYSIYLGAEAGRDRENH